MEVKAINIKELKALLSMLDEPNAELFENISAGIIQYGLGAVPYIEDIADDFLNPLIKSRAENIIRDIRLNNAIENIKEWKLSEKQDILKAWIIIEQLLFPDYDYSIVNKIIENITRDIWLLQKESLNPIQKIHNINFALYNVFKFNIKEEIEFDERFILSKIIEVFKFNYVSATMIYLSIAQKLNFPVFGQMIHNSFILAWINLKKYENFISYLDDKRVLFYISPIMKGEVFDEYQINKYLKKNNIQTSKEFFKPLDNIGVIEFYIQNLHKALADKKMFIPANEMKLILENW